MKESYVRLGDVCEVQNGFAFDSKYFTSNEGEGMPLIRIRDILNGFSKTYYTSDFQEEFIVHKGDFLIGMDGDFNIGQWKSEDALLNQRVCRLIPSNKILPKFIYYYIPTALQEINNKTAYTTVKHLSSKQVKAILLPNLSISEQQRVVDILDVEFEKIDRLRSNAELNLQNAKDLFQVTLTKELEPKEGWNLDTLDVVCSKITDGTHNSPPNTPKGEYKYITAKNIKPWGLDLNEITYVSSEIHKEIYSRCNPCLGDVLYIKDGATTGIAILNPLSEEFSLLSSVALLKPDKRLLKSEFLCYAMNSPQMYKFVRGQMDGAAITRITLSKLKSFVLAFPSLEEQGQIVATLDELSAKCKVLQDNYTKTIALCDDLKQSLLRKAFNGEL